MDTQTTGKTETCSQCKHWNEMENNAGQCRRRPPQAIAFKVDDDVKFEFRFPMTANSDWCGEFEAK